MNVLLLLRRAQIAIICAGIAAAGLYFFAVQQWLVHADGDTLAWLNRTLASKQPHPIEFYVAKIEHYAVFWALLWVGLVPTLGLFLFRISQPNVAVSPWAERGLALLYALLFFLFLIRYGNEEAWYPIEKILNYAGNPPFQHRILLLLPAQALAFVAPSLPYLYDFLFSQMVAVFFALWAIKRFSSLFIHQDLAFIGQFIALAMWAPTVNYYTFYDIAIIAVYAGCLYFLLKERLLPYLLLFIVGTLNHELTLFLVGISALVLFGKVKLPKLAGFLALQLLCWAAVRAIQFKLLPATGAWEGGKPALNIDMILHHPGRVLSALAPLVVWYAVAAAGVRSAPAALRCCLALLPCLLIMTFLVGQFNEARQFDAFIPVAVALIVCAIREQSKSHVPLGQSSPAAYAMTGA